MQVHQSGQVLDQAREGAPRHWGQVPPRCWKHSHTQGPTAGKARAATTCTWCTKPPKSTERVGRYLGAASVSPMLIARAMASAVSSSISASSGAPVAAATAAACAPAARSSRPRSSSSYMAPGSGAAGAARGDGMGMSMEGGVTGRAPAAEPASREAKVGTAHFIRGCAACSLQQESRQQQQCWQKTQPKAQHKRVIPPH